MECEESVRMEIKLQRKSELNVQKTAIERVLNPV